MEQVVQRMERDMKILVHLVKHGFASPQNLEDTFFKGEANRNHYRAIVRLKRRRLVENLIGDNNQFLGYQATKRGQEIAARLNGGKLSHAPRYQFRTNYDHDELLVRIRSIFETSSAISQFRPEQVIREELAKQYGYKEEEGSGYKVPDGLFVLRSPKGSKKVALELELTRKSSNRYRKIVKQLATSEDWDIVFFVTKDKNIPRVVREILKELKEKDIDVQDAPHLHGFYFCDLAEVLDKKLEAKFTGEGSTFSLSRFGQAKNS